MQFVSHRQFVEDVRTWSAELPGDLIAVAGVPRSGILAAVHLALHRNLHLVSVEELIQGKTPWRHSLRRGVPEMPQSSPLRVEGLVLGAQAAAARGDLAEARRKFDEAVACRADADPYPLHEYCRFLFECVDPSEAGAPLQMLADEEPENPSVLANLGTYFRCAGNVEQAVKALQKSVELRPGAIGTRMQLAEMLEAAGQVGASESERRTIEKLRQQAGRPDRGSVGH